MKNFSKLLKIQTVIKSKIKEILKTNLSLTEEEVEVEYIDAQEEFQSDCDGMSDRIYASIFLSIKNNNCQKTMDFLVEKYNTRDLKAQRRCFGNITEISFVLCIYELTLLD